MGLNSMRRRGIETARGVHFAMMHDATSVRVLVAKEVLQSLAAKGPLSLMAKFELHRKEFEAIASDKFDRGNKGPLEITGSDVLKFAAEKRGAVASNS
jgi:hypothetical protein